MNNFEYINYDFFVLIRRYIFKQQPYMAIYPKALQFNPIDYLALPQTKKMRYYFKL